LAALEVLMREALSFLLLAAVVGCGTTVQFTPTNPPPRPLTSRPAESVQVFTASRPDQPFVEVGLLEAQQSSALSLDQRPDVMQKMRVEAARMGCDGIILLGANDQVQGSIDPKYGGSVNTLQGYRATCIMFKQAAGAAVPAAAPAP
jgi:hypothetical protein